MVATLCHTETVTDPKKLGEVLDRAFAAMTAGRPGPAHIQISTNMMGQPCPALAAPGDVRQRRAPAPWPPAAASPPR